MTEDTPNGNSDWFAAWFDSPYYQLLYRHRNQAEAAEFIRRVATHIALPTGAAVLDLACGNGRHSKTLHELGYNVTGVDLSEASLALAREKTPGARFIPADMRELHFDAEFSAVFNLFTSFGYFQATADNTRVLEGIYRALKPSGWLVLDYLNATQVRKRIVPVEAKTLDGVHFIQHRFVQDERVNKEITVKDGDHTEKHTESVQLFELPDFEILLQTTGFELRSTWGNYDGRPFHPERSARLILLAQKVKV